MAVAYIISAYKNPGQLGRLVERLSTDEASFVVHVDRKTKQSDFQAMRASVEPYANVRFLPRHVSHWGGFGHVRATLKGIADLLARDVRFDYAVLLTAQDYPLRSARTIERFLAESGGRSFLSYWALPHPPWGRRGGLERIEDWHLITFRRMHLALPLRRRVPGDLRPYGGGAYWCLARPVVDYIQDFVERNPRYVGFFEHVFIPDELFFQTIVLNSPLRDTVVNDTLRYIDWSREPAPAILGTVDFEKVIASNDLFARKFDVRVDEAILDMIDEHIRARAGSTDS